MSASSSEYAKMYGNITITEENLSMAKCACVKCNSCTCACSCSRNHVTLEEDIEW